LSCWVRLAWRLDRIDFRMLTAPLFPAMNCVDRSLPQ
jgi:hypothetical protein